jgi:hypothetical protein
MANLFDRLQQNAFGVVARSMGYTAFWTPSSGGELQTATVLFNDASQMAKLLEVQYDPQRAMIEYYIGSFDGLKISVDAKNDETVIVNGIPYGVNEVRAKYDGKTYSAYLQLL